MATKKRPKSMYDDTLQDHDLYLDTLTRDEKEAMLNKKMEDIRRKNEALQRRHAEIEADKKEAEEKGYAVSLKAPPEESENKQEKSPMRGVKVTLEEDTLKAGPVSRFSSGRGKRLAKMKGDAIKSQTQEQSRPGGNKCQSEKPNVHDTPPPPETGKSFLVDNRRQGALPDNFKNLSSRNRHSYGGSDFNNVKSQMQQERQKHRFEGPPQTKQEMEMRMTGRERREYTNWKQERDQIDVERMNRQKNKEGIWRREWDIDKKDLGNAPPTPPPSRHVEPGRRPAGRIGSGRFSTGDEKPKGGESSPKKVDKEAAGGDYNKALQPKDHRQFTRPNREEDEDTSKGNHRRSKGYYEGRDENRSVEKQEDNTLVIQVVNDFSGEVLEGRRGAREGGGPRGRGDRASGQQGWGDSRGGRERGRGEGRGRGGYVGHRGDYARGRGEYSGSRGGGEFARGRGEYAGGRGSSFGRGDGGRGEYHTRGDYRGRGGRGGSGGNYRDGGERTNDYGYSRGREARGGRAGGGRGGRGRGPRPRYQEEEPLILGTVVIDTSQSHTGEPAVKGPSPSRKSPPSKAGSIDPGPVSPQSDKSWETASDSQGDVWETEEEEVVEGKGGVNEDDSFEGDEDQYEEDDYWEEGIELQGTHTNIGDEFEQEQSSQVRNGRGPQDEENDEEEHKSEEDAHNSSSESLDRFIQEHTLHLNIRTGNLVTAAESCDRPGTATTPNKSPSDSLLSPLTPMKTPEGHVHVLDWAAETSVEESPKKMDNLSMNTTVTSSDLNDSPDKRIDTEQMTEEGSVSNVVRNLDSDIQDVDRASKEDQTRDMDNACGSESVTDTHNGEVEHSSDCAKKTETVEVLNEKEQNTTSESLVDGGSKAGLLPEDKVEVTVSTTEECAKEEKHVEVFMDEKDVDQTSENTSQNTRDNTSVTELS